ncbi:hypothetical protein HF086_000642 [Spodoptera exigua]|uniref:Uncharacterized protein n=1 Tax=Spodoptera exigua TaxID=7107 RepID=A0A922SEG1_SPOEX|nr:hypothetical protein HF086_000642 [Spodoptera exigua]
MQQSCTESDGIQDTCRHCEALLQILRSFYRCKLLAMNCKKTSASEGRPPERASDPRPEDPKPPFPNGVESPRKLPCKPEPRPPDSRSEERKTQPMCRVRITSPTFPSASVPSSNMPPTNIPSPKLAPTNVTSSNFPPTSSKSSNLAPTSNPSPSFPPTSNPSPHFPPTSIPSPDFPSSSIPSPSLPPTSIPYPNFPPTSIPSSNFLPTSIPSPNFPPTSNPSFHFPPTTIPSPTFPANNIPCPNFPPTSIQSSNFLPTSIPSPTFPLTGVQSSRKLSNNVPQLTIPPPSIPPPDPCFVNPLVSEPLPESSYDMNRPYAINNLGPPLITSHGPVLLSPGALDRKYNEFNWMPGASSRRHIRSPPEVMPSPPTSTPSHHIVIYPVQQEHGPMRHEVFFGCTQPYCHYCHKNCKPTAPRETFATFPGGIWTPQPGEVTATVPPTPPATADPRYGPEAPETSRYNPMMPTPVSPQGVIQAPPGFWERPFNPPPPAPVGNSPILDNPFDEMDLQARLQELERSFANINPYE